MRLARIFLCAVIFLAAARIAEANVILKVTAMNPSTEQPQKVKVKAYLPKEAKPEHIVDRGDLDVAYDTQQGSYYVYGEYELKPMEVLDKDIELRDIWVIQSAEIESMRAETVKIAGLLKNTEFSDRIVFLKNNIESKLNEIVESQKNPATNPEKHISQYRENLRILESVKMDLSLARSLLSQAKAVPTVVVWRLVLAIVIFLGLIGASFYFIWQKQVKAITGEDSFFIPKDEGQDDLKPTQYSDEGKGEER
jgi:predicted HicB family RNase H-like nuclease